MRLSVPRCYYKAKDQMPVLCLGQNAIPIEATEAYFALLKYSQRFSALSYEFLFEFNIIHSCLIKFCISSDRFVLCKYLSTLIHYSFVGVDPTSWT